ncbi:MAG TPA: cation:proton antiporter [Solirubrobacteraceae bacterium]|nr:cation:proton antiporter [Solirubrobacteraceae bacterium]
MGRRLIAYYGVLGAAFAAVLVLVLIAGGRETAAKPIAGGYDAQAGLSCLGPQVDVTQSGQFVDLGNPQGTLGGKLRLVGQRLTGTVSCMKGGSQRLDATVSGLNVTGTLAGQPVRLVFKREPPAPGTVKPQIPGSIAGTYTLSPASPCLGGALTVTGGSQPALSSSAKAVRGSLRYDSRLGTISGVVTCADGTSLSVSGQAAGRSLTLRLTPSGAGGGAPEEIVATQSRSFEDTLAIFFIATAAVMLVARLFGAAITKIGQPRVMGEVVAGIALGPTVLGAISPTAQNDLFPSDIVPIIGVAANLGLIFYMFLVGLEFDPRQLRGRVAQTIAVSNTGVLVPLMGGLLIALPTYRLLGPNKTFAGFALFMGVAMSITAFPVLARIIVERRMLGRPVGALALAAAAIDDVSAWFLIAVASAVAAAGSAGSVVQTVAFAIAFGLVMVFGIRPLLARASVAFEEAGRVPGAWITAIFAGVLLSAYTTQEIGIALIFGAFVMGVVMPRHAGLTEDITRRVEDFVVTLLLPLFFAYTGLRTNVGLLGRSELVWITLALIGVAIAGKFGGALLAARVVKLGWRESAVLGTLMNTRGLTELIVLNLALEKGFMTQALFTSLVLMALVTTFMTGPLLRILDRDRTLSAPIDEELQAARRESLADSPVPIPGRSVLVAPQTDAALGQLVALAEPLARSIPPRELILARLIEPPRGAAVRGGLQTERRALRAASVAVQSAREELRRRGIAARAVAFTSTDPGQDLVRLAQEESVDLILLDGRRPLLGRGVPRGNVGTVLEKAPCDVAVLVARDEQTVVCGPDQPVLVPFGGAEHDWAALELGAWIASASGATLQLLGAAADGQRRDASRLLADAALLVQRFAGVESEPIIAEPGRAGVVEAAAGACLLVIGLSDRWRREGLGPTRAEIAQAAPAPILFVRRGARPGALAARGDVTRFTWSSAAVGSPEMPPQSP